MQRNAAVGNLKCSAVETIGNDGDVPIIKPGKPGPDFFRRFRGLFFSAIHKIVAVHNLYRGDRTAFYQKINQIANDGDTFEKSVGF